MKQWLAITALVLLGLQCLASVAMWVASYRYDGTVIWERPTVVGEGELANISYWASLTDGTLHFMRYDDRHKFEKPEHVKYLVRESKVKGDFHRRVASMMMMAVPGGTPVSVGSTSPRPRYWLAVNNWRRWGFGIYPANYFRISILVVEMPPWFPAAMTGLALLVLALMTGRKVARQDASDQDGAADAAPPL